MDIQAYISSGILESYVLGELSPAEAQEVELMAVSYPEVGEELQQIEAALLGVARAAAVAPRPGLRDSLLAQLDTAAQRQQPAPPVIPLQPGWQAQVQPPLPGTISGTSRYRWLAAAAVTLAFVSSMAAAYFWSRWQQSEAQLASLVAQNTLLVQNVSQLERNAEGMQQSLAVLTNPAYQAVRMKGLAPAPDALAVVYWNPTTEEVFLHAGSLPAPPSDKQYQLWAIVDGQPVDAGVFESTGQQLQKMKEIENASAFAVTLEPIGGSPSPTLEQMYVMGEAS